MSKLGAFPLGLAGHEFTALWDHMMISSIM